MAGAAARRRKCRAGCPDRGAARPSPARGLAWAAAWRWGGRDRLGGGPRDDAAAAGACRDGGTRAAAPGVRLAPGSHPARNGVVGGGGLPWRTRHAEPRGVRTEPWQAVAGRRLRAVAPRRRPRRG